MWQLQQKPGNLRLGRCNVPCICASYQCIRPVKKLLPRGLNEPLPRAVLVHRRIATWLCQKRGNGSQRASSCGRIRSLEDDKMLAQISRGSGKSVRELFQEQLSDLPWLLGQGSLDEYEDEDESEELAVRDRLLAKLQAQQEQIDEEEFLKYTEQELGIKEMSLGEVSKRVGAKQLARDWEVAQKSLTTTGLFKYRPPTSAIAPKPARGSDSSGRVPQSQGASLFTKPARFGRGAVTTQELPLDPTPYFFPGEDPRLFGAQSRRAPTLSQKPSRPQSTITPAAPLAPGPRVLRPKREVITDALERDLELFGPLTPPPPPPKTPPPPAPNLMQKPNFVPAHMTALRQQLGRMKGGSGPGVSRPDGSSIASAPFTMPRYSPWGVPEASPVDRTQGPAAPLPELLGRPSLKGSSPAARSSSGPPGSSWPPPPVSDEAMLDVVDLVTSVSINSSAALTSVAVNSPYFDQMGLGDDDMDDWETLVLRRFQDDINRSQAAASLGSTAIFSQPRSLDTPLPPGTMPPATFDNPFLDTTLQTSTTEPTLAAPPALQARPQPTRPTRRTQQARNRTPNAAIAAAPVAAPTAAPLPARQPPPTPALQSRPPRHPNTQTAASIPAGRVTPKPVETLKPQTPKTEIEHKVIELPRPVQGLPPASIQAEPQIPAPQKPAAKAAAAPTHPTPLSSSTKPATALPSRSAQSIPVAPPQKPAVKAARPPIAPPQKPAAAAPIAPPQKPAAAAPIAPPQKPAAAAPIAPLQKPAAAAPIAPPQKPAAAAPIAPPQKPAAAAPIAPPQKPAAAAPIAPPQKPAAAAPIAPPQKPAAAAPIAPPHKPTAPAPAPAAPPQKPVAKPAPPTPIKPASISTTEPAPASPPPPTRPQQPPAAQRQAKPSTNKPVSQPQSPKPATRQQKPGSSTPPSSHPTSPPNTQPQPTITSAPPKAPPSPAKKPIATKLVVTTPTQAQPAPPRVPSQTTTSDADHTREPSTPQPSTIPATQPPAGPSPPFKRPTKQTDLARSEIPVSGPSDPALLLAKPSETLPAKSEAVGDGGHRPKQAPHKAPLASPPSSSKAPLASPPSSSKAPLVSPPSSSKAPQTPPPSSSKAPQAPPPSSSKHAFTPSLISTPVIDPPNARPRSPTRPPKAATAPAPSTTDLPETPTPEATADPSPFETTSASLSRPRPASTPSTLSKPTLAPDSSATVAHPNVDVTHSPSSSTPSETGVEVNPAQVTQPRASSSAQGATRQRPAPSRLGVESRSRRMRTATPGAGMGGVVEGGAAVGGDEGGNGVENRKRAEMIERAEQHMVDHQVLGALVVRHNSGGVLLQTTSGVLGFLVVGRMQSSTLQLLAELEKRLQASLASDQEGGGLSPAQMKNCRKKALATLQGTFFQVTVIAVNKETGRVFFEEARRTSGQGDPDGDVSSAAGAAERVADATLDVLEENIGNTVVGTVVDVNSMLCTLQFEVMLESGDQVPVTGTIHKSQISWEGLVDPSTVYSLGQEVSAVVMMVDRVRQWVQLSARHAQAADNYLDPVAAAVGTQVDERVQVAQAQEALPTPLEFDPEAPLEAAVELTSLLPTHNGIMAAQLGPKSLARATALELRVMLKKSEVPARDDGVGAFEVLVHYGLERQSVLVTTNLGRDEFRGVLADVLSGME